MVKLLVKSAKNPQRRSIMSEMNLEDINRMAKESPLELVRTSEQRYRSLVSNLASRVKKNEEIRVILLAGPSGSGKTTTANLLSDALISAGEESMVVSLDDFYRNSDDPQYPRLKNGERDFETVDALDLPFLIKTLADIAAGRPFLLPKYDFKLAKRTEVRKIPAMPHGCVIIEGLHALNPKVFSDLSKDKLLKIFISVSTNVNEGGVRIISGRKVRFLRRMIRDSLYRGADAERTLSLWKNVLIGEDKYLYPHRNNADVSFDTFHPFELSVMRSFAQRLISSELASREEYAAKVLDAINRVVALDAHIVPETSLIREFIPGGKYEALY